jgi:hypothetical protein
MNYKCYAGSALLLALGFAAGSHFSAKKNYEAGHLEGRLSACKDATVMLGNSGFPVPLDCTVDAGEVYFTSPAAPGKEVKLDFSGSKE